MFVIESKIIRQEANHDEYFKVRQVITQEKQGFQNPLYKRVLTDCQHFETRAEAMASIPEMERDLKEYWFVCAKCFHDNFRGRTNLQWHKRFEI